jgi:hypothetical protein
MKVTLVEKLIAGAVVLVVIVWVGSFLWLVAEVNEAGGPGAAIEQGLIDIGKSFKHIGEEIDKD